MQNPLKLINIDMAGQFTTHIYISMIAGLIIAIHIRGVGIMALYQARTRTAGESTCEVAQWW
jgi:hypothetical protein